MDRADVRAERSPSRCPYCRDELEVGGKTIVACAACGARHHDPCHAEHGRCASCGATDVLAPREGPRARPSREAPPKGSTIEVRQGPDGLRILSWPVRAKTAGEWVLLAVMIATLILAPFVLWSLWRHRDDHELWLRLGPDWLDVPVMTGMSWRMLRVGRGDLGAVRVDRGQNDVYQLTLDVGVDRYTLCTLASLKAPELEWLAEQLLAWRDQS